MESSIQSSLLPSPARIHPSSIIDQGCILGHGVKIGPFCIVGKDVRIGDNTNLISNVTVMGETSIGKNCLIYPHAVLGSPSQAKVDEGDHRTLTIGNDCIIREGVTANLGTEGTAVGNRVLLMANTHVAHDCKVADDVVLVNGALLGGHVVLEQGAIISGRAGVVQHCRVGQFAFVAASTTVSRDVLPFSMVNGHRARTTGLNVVGLQRKGWSEKRISTMQQAVEMLFRKDLEGIKGLLQSSEFSKDIRQVIDFRRGSKRGVCLPTAKTNHHIVRAKL
jgi:UDP-N-acetylglucosamine acyltransferase